MRFAYISFFCLLSPLYADVITTSTSCSAQTGNWTGSGNMTTLSATSPSSCSEVGSIHVDSSVDPMHIPSSLPSRTNASASASGSYSLAGNVVSGELKGDVGGSLLADAMATATFSDTFTTAGPVREGVVTGSFLPFTFRDGALVGVSIVSPTLPRSTFGPTAPPMPFELGQPFTLTITGYAQTSYDGGLTSFAQFNAPFQLNFFEADGVTPVRLTEVSAAPEPSTWASLAGGLVMLGFLRRRVAR